jgi:sialate O-acetylesterase
MLLAVAVAFCAQAATAKVEPAQIICDHMVLQRGKPVPVWGWADKGEKVTVQFAGQTRTATAGEDRKWMVTLDPLELSAKPRVLTIAGAANTVTISDVLVGDVWLCSGQSNMGRSVAASVIPPDMKWSYPMVRFWGIGGPQPYPIEKYQPQAANPWKVCANEETIKQCCAVGFFFARRVQQDVDVPIGILWEAFAGSIIQEWIPQCAWRLDPALAGMADRVDEFYPNTPKGREVWKERLAEIKRWTARAETAIRTSKPLPYPQPQMPQPGNRDIACFYNGKIHPCVPFAIKGVLWYQGESDMGNAQWAVMLKVMAKSWRDLFSVNGDGADIPFYWMQIQRSGDYCSTLNRQQAFDALNLVPNGGMAVLLDLDIAVHPANKVDSGIRLALWALKRDYGKKDIVPSGPLYKGHRAEGNRLIVEFYYADGGLRVGEKDMLNPPSLKDSGELTNVELAGKDGKWHKAVGKLDGQTMAVTSDKVAEPVAVRYAFECIPPGPFLYNAAGLPAAMFTSQEDQPRR